MERKPKAPNVQAQVTNEQAKREQKSQLEQDSKQKNEQLAAQVPELDPNFRKSIEKKLFTMLKSKKNLDLDAEISITTNALKAKGQLIVDGKPLPTEFLMDRKETVDGLLADIKKRVSSEEFTKIKMSKFPVGKVKGKFTFDKEARALTLDGQVKIAGVALPLHEEISLDKIIDQIVNESQPKQAQKTQTKAEPVTAPKKDGIESHAWYKALGGFLNHKYMNWFLGLGDVLSAGTDIFKWVPSLKKYVESPAIKNLLPWKDIKEVIDVWSVRLTKIVIMARFVLAGIGALLNNRIVEAFGRIVGIAALPMVSLRDLTMATGLSTAFSQTDLGLEEKLGAKSNRIYTSMWENASEWFGTWWRMTKEMFSTTLFGANRKVFPDFAWSQITDIPRRFIEDFTSKIPKKGRPGEKEEGHSAIFGAYFIGIGALIGVLFGRKERNIWNKLGGLIRNFGGILGDYTLFTHTDVNMRKTGYFTAVASIVDVIQRFLPDWMINTINHLNLINNMIGLSYYSDRTDKKTEGDIDVYQDLDSNDNAEIQQVIPDHAEEPELALV